MILKLLELIFLYLAFLFTWTLAECLDWDITNLFIPCKYFTNNSLHYAT